MTFLITGMARSRTQWLSNFMDTGEVTCFHDLSRSVTNEHDYFDRLERPYTGTCDTAISLVPGVIERFRRRPWVLVIRDADAAVESAVRVGFPERAAWKAAQASVEFMHRVREQCDRVLVVAFDDLSITDTGRAIWKHCVDLPFPAERWERLQAMKVDLQPDKVMLGRWFIERAAA